MDPNKCLQAAMECLQDAQDWPRASMKAASLRLEALQRWLDLQDWLRRGGFAPSDQQSFTVLHRYMRMYGSELRRLACQECGESA